MLLRDGERVYILERFLGINYLKESLYHNKNNSVQYSVFLSL